MKRGRSRKQLHRLTKARFCVYCQKGEEKKREPLPDYKQADKLRPFVSERGRIVSRARTGICSKHQRKIAQEIKRARHLGLLPFVSGIK